MAMPLAHPYARTVRPASARRRLAALSLAIAAHLLVIALLLYLSPPPPRFVEVKPPSSFQLLPDAPAPSPAPVPAPVPRKRPRIVAKAAASPPAPAQPQPVAATPPPPPPVAQPKPAPTLFSNPDLFQSADIGKMHSSAPAGDDDTGKESASVYGPGEGPGGQRLYDVEWYREPTHAELAFYMPPGGAPPGSWATVACRMVGATMSTIAVRSASRPPARALPARCARLRGSSWSAHHASAAGR